MALVPFDPRLVDHLSVLVVDDEPEAVGLVIRIVEALGFDKVSGAGSGREAIELLERSQPNIVITDLMMPDVDGAALLAHVKQRNPTVAVVVMSVVDSVPQAVRMLKSGADDYLTKPIDPELLRGRMATIVSRLAVTQEVEDLRAIIDRGFRPPGNFVWGASSKMLEVAARVPALARTDAPVLIHGESGTGKELLARAIHYASRRAGGPMISVNCASVAETLWEREFFGHVKGAFSDAGAGGPGVIAAADGGTLFLDEVGEIPQPMQAKLLRFLQEKEYRPVGSATARKADVRIVSATNRELREAVEAGDFREDLYYRLDVLPLAVPPLRERKEDIPLLASFFLRRYAAEFDKQVHAFSPLALQKLCSYDFAGNVRELENVVQRALVESRRSVICAGDIPVGDPAIVETGPAAAQPSAATPPPAARQQAGAVRIDLPYHEARQLVLREFEHSYVSELLERNGGNVNRAAKQAEIPRKSFSRIMKRHDLAAGPEGEGGRPGRPRKKADP